MYEKLTGNAAPKGNDELRQSQKFHIDLVSFTTVIPIRYVSYHIFTQCFVDLLRYYCFVEQKLSDLAIFQIQF